MMKWKTEAKSPGGKIIQFPLVRIVIAFAWLIAIYVGTQSILRLLPAKGTMPITFLSTGISVVAICLAYYAFVRTIEKRPVSEFGKANACKELATGTLVGAGLFSVTVGILWAIGCFKVTGMGSWTAAAYVLIASILAGVFEEILFRGVLFRIMEQWMGTWVALLLSGLIFGLLHLLNPGASLGVGVMIALEAGVLLAAAFVYTRRLWFAIGLHFSWNFVQGGIFGANVSGGESSGVLKSALTGPDLLSGGKFGAEASVVAVTVCTIASIYLLWKAKQKGNFIKPFWGRKPDTSQPDTALDTKGAAIVAG